MVDNTGDDKILMVPSQNTVYDVEFFVIISELIDLQCRYYTEIGVIILLELKKSKIRLADVVRTGETHNVRI